MSTEITGNTMTPDEAIARVFGVRRTYGSHSVTYHEIVAGVGDPCVNLITGFGEASIKVPLSSDDARKLARDLIAAADVRDGNL